MARNRLLLIVLLTIFLVAFFMRCMGVPFGFPLFVHPDEPQLVKAAFSVAYSGDFNPHFFVYPSFYIYLQSLLYYTILVVGKILRFYQGWDDITLITLFSWGRTLTVFFSMGILCLVYLIAKRLFTKSAAVISLLFIAFSYLHIKNSFVITTDSAMTFWVMMSFYFAMSIYLKGPRLKYYILSGFLGGLAVGTKYTAVFCVLPMIFAHLCHFSFSLKKILTRNLFLGLLAVPLVFTLTTPYIILDYTNFAGQLSYLKNFHGGVIMHYGHLAESFSLMYYLKVLWSQYGVIQLVISLLGILFLWTKDKGKVMLLTALPIFYILFFSLYKGRYDRYLLVTIPFLALAGGYGATEIFDYLKRVRLRSQLKKYVLVLLFFLIGFGISQQINKSWNYIRTINLPDTRFISEYWIKENIPYGAKIGREHYTPTVDPRYFRPTYLGFWGLAEKELKDFDYVIASSYDYGRFFNESKRYPEFVKRYNEIFSENELVKEFIPDNKSVGGPTVRIYKIK